MLVICPHPEGLAPGQRLKYEQYFRHFEEAGVEVIVKPFESMGFWNVKFKKGYGAIAAKVFWTIIAYIQRFFLLFSIPRYDVVYVFLWVTPFGPPIFEWFTAKLAKRMIYDIDDLIFLKNTSYDSKLVDALKGKNKPKFLMKHADHVITCTPFLTEYALQFNPDTTDISSTINTDLYRQKTDYSLREGKLVLGWSGSKSTAKYLRLLEPVFAELKKQIDFKIVMMGDADFTLPGYEVEAMDWREEIETKTINRFDIGLYPLPNEQWVYGKSGLKALQYMATGVPTVATAIGANYRVMETGVSGFLVETPEQWIERILQLAKDEQLRRYIGTNAHERVEKSYSVRANAPVYVGILQKVLNSK